ncbi:MAG: Spy/CpxP family protein refolding chaperone [Acidobacteriota bacterium]
MRASKTLVTAVLFVAGCIGAFGQRSGPPDGFGGGRMFGRMFKNLDLTDQQRTDIRKVLEAERSIMQPIREQLRENREALQAATKDGQFNEAEVTKVAERQGELMAQMIVSRERVKAQIWQILTPEQREKLPKWGERGFGDGSVPMRFQRGPRRSR